MVLLVSGIEAFAFIALVIAALVAIGVLFFAFLMADRPREAGSGKLDDRR